VAANDFVRQWEEIRDDALLAVDRVGASGWLILGEEVAELERELARWWGFEHAVGVASGLDALEIALRSAGIEAGARVVTTPLTAFATTLAIARIGATPVWCDVEQSGGLDLEQVRLALESDELISAVVPVHLYGHPLDPGRLAALAQTYGVIVIEDCAQSAGAARDGLPTGAAGKVAATSFYPTKNLGAMGDGGALLTNDGTIAERAARLRNYGQRARYEHTELGLNSRLDELHAAVLRSAMLPRLGEWLARRREIAARYTQALGDGPLRPILQTGGDSAHHLFPVESMTIPASEAVDALALRGVSAGRHYPRLCPDQPAAGGLGDSLGALPVARRIAERELSLPIHPFLGDDEVEHVIEAVVEICA
jgi:dTDP-3-amino-3,4,6-trideoxy-alpha-D-glucose transaminase